MANARRLNPQVSDGARLFVAMMVLLALVAGSCNSGGDVDDIRAEPAVVRSETADPVPLPVREGPRTETTYSVPHVQTFVDAVPDVDTELRRRIYSLPGVESRETIVSFTGTTALWFSEEAEPSELTATLREREFGHLHPDGSLHTVLPVERALEATSAKWAELHPWVGREDFWDGMVMLYTPQSFEELEVTWQLIVDSYNFVTGQNLNAVDFVAD